MNNVCLLKYRLSSAGGLEKQAWRIAKAFSRRAVPVTFFTSTPHEESQLYPLIKIVQMKQKQTLFTYQNLRSFDGEARRFLKQHPFRVIFGLDRTSYQTHIRAGNGVHAAFLKRRAPLETSLKKWSLQINPLHRTILDIERRAFENPDLRLLFTNSHMVKNEVLEHYRTPEEKICVIHNGVEWHEMEKPFSDWVESKNRLSLDLNLDPTSFHFLFIGNGFKRKGLDLLLKALATLKNEDFHLSVVGKDRNIKEYLALTEQLGLSDKVSYFGMRKDVASFYQMADALVIPSLYDPFANVTVEALAMGLFVISSKFNGGSEILTPEKGAIIDDLFDTDSLVVALKEALSHPKAWLQSQARRNSIKELDFQNQLDKMIDRTL